MTLREAHRLNGRATALPISLLLATVVAAIAPSVARAQAPRLEVDVNASRIQYDTLSALSAPSVAALAEWQTPSFHGRLNGGLTSFEGAGWSAQGRADVAGWLEPFARAPSLHLELAGAGSLAHHSSGFDSYVARSDARLHVASGGGGLWGGLGLAVAKSSLDSASVTGVVPALGIWGQRGPVRATLQYLHTTIEGERYPEASLVLTLGRGPLDVTLYGGMRRSSLVTDAFDDQWVGGSAALWVHDHAAVIVSGGRYPSDVLQGLPGGDFISVGIRLTPRRNRPIPLMVAAPIVYSAERLRSNGIMLRVPGASRVEIAGDWNGWQPEPLEPAGRGVWRVTTTLEPGVYRFNLLVDGERWIVPEGVPAVEGGYGDRVGLLIVSQQ